MRSDGEWNSLEDDFVCFIEGNALAFFYIIVLLQFVFSTIAVCKMNKYQILWADAFFLIQWFNSLV